MSTEVSLTMDSTLLSNNSASFYGAMLIEFDSSVICTADTTENSGFTNNSSTTPTAVLFLNEGSTFSSQDCDFGSGSTDNTPIDISTSAFNDYMYGENSVFSCANNICSP